MDQESLSKSKQITDRELNGRSFGAARSIFGGGSKQGQSGRDSPHSSSSFIEFIPGGDLQLIIITRIVLALLLGLVGFQIADSADVVRLLEGYAEKTVRYVLLIGIGVITGLLVGGLVGKLLERGLDRLRTALRSRSGAELVVGAFGLLIGLGVSALVAIPVTRLEFIGRYMLLPITMIISYIFAEIAAVKHEEILRLVGVRLERGGAQGKLLDTSVLIDGRIADIAATGFVEGEFVVPVFVLEELQNVADSSDELRRARGRRGLDVVQQLRRGRLLTTPGEDYPDVAGVDSKLVKMAAERDFAIVTTDFNLNKVAQIQQIKVLNINELANAIKPEFVAGEQFELKIIREGKEHGQGVGYLDDGTMVIVDRGRDAVGQLAQVEVTSVLQSPSGKLVFTRLVSFSNPAASQEQQG